MARLSLCWILALTLATIGVVAFGQDRQSASSLFSQAQREFKEKKYAAAEQDFREVARLEPSNIHALIYLGESLFNQEKYAEAVIHFERARELESRAKVLSLDQKRILTDQLAMAYGISGQMRKAHALLDKAIQDDPKYPLNYYNAACAFAEEGDKARMLSNLALAFEHKDNVLKGEQMPDPRSDSSFQKYLRDPEFMKLMKDLGFK